MRKSTIRPIKLWLLDMMFPRHCLGCMKLISEFSGEYIPRFICQDCLEATPVKKSKSCAFCNAPTLYGETCPFCLREHYLDQLIVTADYKNALVEKIVKTMKYSFVSSLALEISWLMAGYMQSAKLGGIDWELITAVPVPLHKRRLNWRGFNQSKRIAEIISRILKCKYEPNALKRIKYRKPQAEITERAKRIKNSAGLFKYNLQKPLQGGALLIDDVTTTGATLDECARILKEEGGARRVIGAVFAKG